MVEPLAAEPTALEADARWLGAAAWFEGQLFECLGGWVQSTPEPAVPALLAAQSHHHAWHAELFRTRVPVRAELPAEPYLVAEPGARALAEALAAATATVERLAIAFRVVLPRLLAAYGDRLERANPATDRPLVRALTLVVRDDRDDLLAGERALQKLLLGPAEVTRAAQAVEQAESSLVGAGGFLRL